MRARDLMTSPVVTVRADTPAKEAVALLVTHGFTLLPVVDENDVLLGVVTEADLIEGRILPDPRALIGDVPPPPAQAAADRVSGALTAAPVVITPTTDATEIATTMLDRHLRALPVVDGDRLVGVVTRRDLLRTIARDDQDIARDVRRHLAAVCLQPWDVEVADGVVGLATEGAEPGDRHIAEVVAASRPGVRQVRVLGPIRAGSA